MTRASVDQADKSAPPQRSGGGLSHPAKAIYFATGSPELALHDIARLGLSSNGTALRVVSPQAGCRQLRGNAALKNAGVIAYSHGRALWVWLRLMAFLGLTRDAELICLDTPQNYRLLKLLAFSLRGRGRFSTGDTHTPRVSVLGMIRLSWHNYWIRRRERIARLPLLVVGSGSARSLRLIASRLRRRFPGERLIAWLPEPLAGELAGVFDEQVVFAPGAGNYLRATAGLFWRSRQFKAGFVLCTNEFNRWMKLPALLAPLRRKEVYNEVGDSFRIAGMRCGLVHLHWRFMRTERKLAWPVAVLGSASGYYLEKIVASLRRSFPGSEIHGWLGPLQAASAGHLFDVVHPLPSSGPSASAALRLMAHGRRYRTWIIPCTDEPFRWLKLLAFAYPLPQRRLYNETGDGFPLRAVATVWRHLRWRLRYKFTVQFLSGSSDSTLLRRLIHVPVYALRLASAAPMLLRATRHRAKRTEKQDKTVTVLVSGSDSSAALRNALTPRAAGTHPPSIHMDVEPTLADEDPVERLIRAAQSSAAEYLCLLDADCQISTDGWLAQLLEAFDETVAQVGPELHVEGRQEVYQGALFDSRGGAFWNTNSAARFHRRQEWLEVAALPSACLVIRRAALLAVLAGKQRHSAPHMPANDLPLLSELGHLLAINGWVSICDTRVSALYPLKARANQLQFSTAL